MSGDGRPSSHACSTPASNLNKGRGSSVRRSSWTGETSYSKSGVKRRTTAARRSTISAQRWSTSAAMPSRSRTRSCGVSGKRSSALTTRMQTPPISTSLNAGMRAGSSISSPATSTPRAPMRRPRGMASIRLYPAAAATRSSSSTPDAGLPCAGPSTITATMRRITSCGRMTNLSSKTPFSGIGGIGGKRPLVPPFCCVFRLRFLTAATGDLHPPETACERMAARNAFEVCCWG